MLIKRLWIFLLFSLLLSCQNTQTKSDTIISGTLPAMANQMIYLDELKVHKAILMDSCKLDASGYFNFHFQAGEAGFYILKTSAKNSILLQLNKNEKVKLTCSNRSFGTDYQLEGSPGSEELRKFEAHMNRQKARIDSIGKIYYHARGTEEYISTKNRLDSVYQSWVDNYRAYVLNYIDQHPKSLTSLLVLNRKLGKTKVIDEEKDYEALYRLDSSLSLAYPGNDHVRDHHQRVLEIKGRIFDNYVAEEKLSPGRKAPDIILPDTSGKRFSVKSYTGHPVLVQFWAGWSAPSRRDNIRLKKNYPRFKDKNIRLLGVSLDENEVVWKGALKLDQMPWQQVGDLQGFGSPIKTDFHIPDELPYYFLLDKDLIITYKNESLDSILVHMDALFF